MADIAGYVIYKLFGTNGGGVGPAEQVANCGMTLDGGLYSFDGYMFGYLQGDPSKVLQTITAMQAWQARELTYQDAVKWANSSIPVNTTQPDQAMPGPVMYVGPAEIDSTGMIVRPMSETPWDTTGVETWESGRCDILNNLSNSDPEISRVVEDLIDLLIAKGVFNISELPSQARNKLDSRNSWRSQL